MKKLSRDDYFDLQEQYDRTPSLEDGYLPSGEHYILVALLGRLGYRITSSREALKLAEKLLSIGYDDDSP